MTVIAILCLAFLFAVLALMLVASLSSNDPSPFMLCLLLIFCLIFVTVWGASKPSDVEYIKVGDVYHKVIKE